MLTEGRFSQLQLDGRGDTEAGNNCVLHRLLEIKLTYSTGELVLLEGPFGNGAANRRRAAGHNLRRFGWDSVF